MDAPYEWWMEGGEGELGAFIGVVRTQNLDPDTTVYTFSHDYNSDGKVLGGGIPRGVCRNQWKGGGMGVKRTQNWAPTPLLYSKKSKARHWENLTLG